MTHLSETCRSWLILIVGGLEGRGTYSCQPVGSDGIRSPYHMHMCKTEIQCFCQMPLGQD